MRALGNVTTASTSKVPITSTAYTEQTSGAQRSLKSSSASDDGTGSPGTGIRTVVIKYFTLSSAGVIAGPFYETVALNGTAAVTTVATDIALIDSFYAAEAGSGQVAAGTISLYANTAGTGTVIASIAIGQVSTYLGHHYVANGKQCQVLDLAAQGGDAASTLVEIDVIKYPLASYVEQTYSGPFGTTATLPGNITFADAAAAPIAGPARIRLQVTPGNTNSQQTVASFGFVDVVTNFSGR